MSVNSQQELPHKLTPLKKPLLLLRQPSVVDMKVQKHSMEVGRKEQIQCRLLMFSFVVVYMHSFIVKGKSGVVLIID